MQPAKQPTSTRTAKIERILIRSWLGALSPHGRRTVAVRSPYGRRLGINRFLHLHEKGILTEVRFFIAIV
jgi:hypothetical protein